MFIISLNILLVLLLRKRVSLKSQCGSSARWDLCGGSQVTSCPTVTVKITGVESEGANAMYLSLKKNKLVEIEKCNNIADGLAVEEPGKRAFEIVRKYVDEVVVVSDEEIKKAMVLLLERAKLLVEPSGAASLAAIISRQLSFKDEEVVAILSGGNIDLDKLIYILEEEIA